MKFALFALLLTATQQIHADLMAWRADDYYFSTPTGGTVSQPTTSRPQPTIAPSVKPATQPYYEIPSDDVIQPDASTLWNELAELHNRYVNDRATLRAKFLEWFQRNYRNATPLQRGVFHYWKKDPSFYMMSGQPLHMLVSLLLAESGINNESGFENGAYAYVGEYAPMNEGAQVKTARSRPVNPSGLPSGGGSDNPTKGAAASALTSAAVRYALTFGSITSISTAGGATAVVTDQGAGHVFASPSSGMTEVLNVGKQYNFGNPKHIAMTPAGKGSLAIFGYNNVVHWGLDAGLVKNITDLATRKQEIRQIIFNPADKTGRSYVILFNKGSVVTAGSLPKDLVTQLTKLASEGRTIDTIAIAPNGNWYVGFDGWTFTGWVNNDINTQLLDMNKKGFHPKVFSFTENNGAVIRYEKNPAASYYLPSFNADKRVDIILTKAGQPKVLMMAGHHVEASVDLSFSLSQDYQIAGVADLDLDGQNDLVLQNIRTGAIAAQFMNGIAAKNAPLLFNKQINHPDWKVRAVVDMDGDGSFDLIWQNQTDGFIAIWYMKGLNFIAAAKLDTAINGGWMVVGARSFDGDASTMELIFQHTSGSVGIMSFPRNRGNAAKVLPMAAQSILAFSLKADALIMAVDDFNNDGQRDVLVQNKRNGYTSVIYLKNGKGEMLVEQPLSMQFEGWSVSMNQMQGLYTANTTTTVVTSATGSITPAYSFNVTSGLPVYR